MKTKRTEERPTVPDANPSRFPWRLLGKRGKVLGLHVSDCRSDEAFHDFWRSIPFAGIVIEAGEDGVQVGDADVLGEDFAYNIAKIGSKRQVAAFESNPSPTPATNSSLLGSGSV